MKIELMATTPEQVCVTFEDGHMEVMPKSEWDKRQVK